MKDPNTLKAAIDELCAFKIADRVCSAALAARWASALAGIEKEEKLHSGRPCGPPIYIVFQREIVECHGGVQLHYAVRDELGQIHKYAEFELVPAQQVIDAQLAEGDRREGDRRDLVAEILKQRLEDVMAAKAAIDAAEPADESHPAPYAKTDEGKPFGGEDEG